MEAWPDAKADIWSQEYTVASIGQIANDLEFQSILKRYFTEKTMREWRNDLWIS